MSWLDSVIRQTLQSMGVTEILLAIAAALNSYLAIRWWKVSIAMFDLSPL